MKLEPKTVIKWPKTAHIYLKGLIATFQGPKEALKTFYLEKFLSHPNLVKLGKTWKDIRIKDKEKKNI